MTRVARVLSELGHYHVMVKGCADQLIFEDDDDRCYFLNLMHQRFFLTIFGCSLGASWTIMCTSCLMIPKTR